MPIEIRIPVRIVGAAAGRMIVSACRNAPDLERARHVAPFLAHTLRTPKAVLISIGHSAQMKITKTDETLLSLIV